MTKTKAALLSAMARAVINELQDPNKWCCGAMAKDAFGKTVFATSPEAEKWCAIGHCFRLFGISAADEMLCAFTNSGISRDGLAFINDHKGREGAIEALNSFVALMSGKSQ